MPEIIGNDKLFLRCPGCGKPAISHLKKGGLFSAEKWQDAHCYHCSREVSPKVVATVICPECGALTEKTADQICMACGHTTAPAVRVDLPDAEAMRTLGGNGLVMWKHPDSEFSFRSRMIVGAGTQALMLQNGVCLLSLDPGSYLLEETDLTQRARLDKAMEDDTVVLRTDVYCISRLPISISWGAFCNVMQDPLTGRSYHIGGFGTAAFAVFDARLFAEKFGYREIPVDEMTNPETGLPRLTRELLVGHLGTAVKRLLGTVPMDSLNTRMADLGFLAESFLKEDLQRIGLDVTAFNLNTLRITQTRSSLAAEELVNIVGRAYDWEACTTVHIPDHPELTAVLTAKGSMELEVMNREKFLNSHEIREQLLLPLNADLDRQPMAPGQTHGLFDPEKVADSIARLCREAMSDVLPVAAQKLLNAGAVTIDKLPLEPETLEQWLLAQTSDRLDRLGLCFRKLTPKIQLQYSEAMQTHLTASTRKEDIRAFLEDPLDWVSGPVKVHEPNLADCTADVMLKGTCILRISEEDTFFRSAKLRELLRRPAPITAADLQSLFSELVKNALESASATELQTVIDSERADLLNLDPCRDSITGKLAGRMDSTLKIYGLAIKLLTITHIRTLPSDALVNYRNLDGNRGRLRSFLARSIPWTTNEITVHEKDEKTCEAYVAFSGSCDLTIEDEAVFFGVPEVQTMLNDPASITEQNVRELFRSRINGILNSDLAGVIQPIINQNDVDVLSLDPIFNKFNESVRAHLAGKLKPWGLGVHLLNTERAFSRASDILQQTRDAANRSVASELEVRRNDVENEKTVRMAESNSNAGNTISDLRAQDTIRSIGRDTELADARAAAQLGDIENRRKLAEAQQKADHQVTMLADVLAEELRTARHSFSVKDAERAYELLRLRFDQDSAMKYADLIERYKRDDQALQHDIDTQRRKDEGISAHDLRVEESKRAVEAIRHAVGLDDAAFKETLTGILHRIDESNLSWQEKLDAYNRLQRQLGVTDDNDRIVQDAKARAEARLTAAGAEAEETRLLGDVSFNGKLQDLKLSTEQANLNEAIARYAEDRKRRIDEDAASLKERADILQHQQRLEAERQRLADQMEQLKLRYESEQQIRLHEAAMKDKDNEIEALKLTLAYQAEAGKEAGLTERTKAQAEAELRKYVEESMLRKTEIESICEFWKAQALANADARKTEAQAAAEAKRTEAEISRSDAMTRQARELYENAARLQQELEKARIDVDKVRAEGNVKIEEARSNAETAGLAGRLDQLLRTVSNPASEQGKAADQHFRELTELISKIAQSQDKNNTLLNELGRKAESRCPRCGAPKSGRFCPECGYPAGTQTGPGPAPTPAPYQDVLNGSDFSNYL